jgi:hypothetical protein
MMENRADVSSEYKDSVLLTRKRIVKVRCLARFRKPVYLEAALMSMLKVRACGAGYEATQLLRRALSKAQFLFSIHNI